MQNMLLDKGCKLSYTSMYREQPLPSIHQLDALIIMGGPMSVHHADQHPWLTLEKVFIASVMRRQVPVLGVCLGAQLIADVLGAAVTQNLHTEIGWFPVKRVNRLPNERLQSLPASFDALHWHQDTFETPSGATNFLVSEGCANQAFIYGDTTLGLQFHLELLPTHVRAIYQASGKLEKSGPYTQSVDKILASADKFRHAGNILKKLLEDFIFQKSTLK